MHKGLIIFDFDGTIADSTDIAYQVYETLAYTYGFKMLTKEEINELQTLSIQERLKKHKISIFQLPKLARKTRKIVKELVHKTYPYVGMKNLLIKLREEGYLLTIVSSNSKSNIEDFMKLHDLPKFDLILGNASFFGKEKRIKKVMKHFKGVDAIYVGDELRDIISCQSIPIPIISVSWGFDDEALLKAADPDYVAHDIKTLEHMLTQHVFKGA